MNLIRQAKKVSLITMIDNRNGIVRSITTVLKMIPVSVIAAMPYNKEDSWWSVRTIVVPVIVIFVPHAVLLTTVNLAFEYIKNHDVLIYAIYMNMYCAIVAVQYEFIERYIKWAIREEKMTHNEKIMKEEQKLD